MSGRLEGKRVLITGTAGGQGRAAMDMFAREGAAVAGCDIEPGAAEAVAEELSATGVTVFGHTADMGDPRDAERWVREAAEALGGVDVLYNNAGAARFGALDQISVDDWNFVIRNELSIVFYGTRAAWPFLKGEGGSIINTASVAGLVGHGGMPSIAHVAAKGAVISMTRQMAAEGALLGIRANTITPGFIESPATAAAVDAKTRARMLSEFMIQRPGTASEVATLALYLASDESAYVTGTNVVIDGGTTAGRSA